MAEKRKELTTTKVREILRLGLTAASAEKETVGFESHAIRYCLHHQIYLTAVNALFRKQFWNKTL